MSGSNNKLSLLLHASEIFANNHEWVCFFTAIQPALCLINKTAAMGHDTYLKEKLCFLAQKQDQHRSVLPQHENDNTLMDNGQH